MIPTPEQLDLEFFPTIINGKPEAIYLVFRRGIRAKKTLRFHNDHGHRLNIDVGSDGLPIAMELIGGAKPVPDPSFPP